jgi:peptidoglycan/xylan/chitin deacetylase (PgdA/CDA1 family)
LTEHGSGFLRKLLKSGAEQASEPTARHELHVAEPTIGLCFDYERGFSYSSEYLSDAGLETIMKTLQKHKLRATFHCPAKLCETAAAKIEGIVQAGHEVAALGYTDELPPTLTTDALKQMLFATRGAFASRGHALIGFRSPRSKWDHRLKDELVREHFTYSSEHDHAKQPYYLATGKHPLIRIPIRTDDSHLRGRKEQVELAIAKHHRVVRKAIQGRYFAAICFHPWILAEEPDRMRHWHEWLDAILQTGVKTVALRDVLPKNLLPARETPKKSE